MTNPTTRDILGFRFVPPPAVTRLVVRLRRGLGSARQRAAPPPIRVLEAMFGLFDNRVLALMVEFDIPEMLDQPKTLAELSAATNTDADALERVLRYAAGRGFLNQDRRGMYRANDLTVVLRRDHPNSWRGWVEFAGSDWFWQAWRHLDESVREGRSGIEAAFGQPFFEYVNNINPAAGGVFNRAMAPGGMLQALALAKRLDWSGVASVCDVGGGTGATLEYLLGTRTHMTGVLFDLPEVVRDARAGLRSGELSARCTVVGGNFFENVPAECDRYLLLAIVHDWSDDEAVALLRRVAEAMGPTARAVVVDSVLPGRPIGDFAEATHLLMRVLATGRERTEGEFSELFLRAGLRLHERHVLATGFVAFVLACSKSV